MERDIDARTRPARCSSMELSILKNRVISPAHRSTDICRAVSTLPGLELGILEASYFSVTELPPGHLVSLNKYCNPRSIRMLGLIDNVFWTKMPGLCSI